MQPINQPVLVLSNKYILCNLCQQSALQPRLCPRCSGCFCNHCLLAAWTSGRSECPRCLQTVKIEEFLQSNLVIEMVELIAEGVRRQQKRKEEREKCREHDLPHNYYCLQCKRALCGDCGLLTKQHTTHKIVAYRDIYQKSKAKVLEELPRFDRKLSLLHLRKAQLREGLSELERQYRLYKKRFEEEFLNYADKVQAEASEQQLHIAAIENLNTRRLQELQVLRDSIFEEMETKTQISLIEQAPSLIESIQALASQEAPPARNEVNSEIDELDDLMPEYITWDYALTEFSSKSGIIYSSEKSLNGIDWRLKIYPRGNGLARDRYISVFVEMTKGLVSENKYEYRIELLNIVYPELSVRREYCSTFQIGECWGYNQFEPLEELTAKEFIHQDTLHFRIAIRNRSYCSLAHQQKLYLAQLERQVAQRRVEGKSTDQGECEESRVNSERIGTLERIKQFLLKDTRKGFS